MIDTGASAPSMLGGILQDPIDQQATITMSPSDSSGSGTLNIQSLTPPPQPGIPLDGGSTEAPETTTTDNDAEEIDQPIDSEISDLEKQLKELKEKEERLRK